MNDALAPFPLEEHQRLAAGVRHAAVVVTNILERYIDPTSVLDLGCGTGMWLRVLAANGHRQVFGVEQQSYAPGNLEVHPDLVLTADLGQHLDLHRRFDLLVCLEVAEHIDGSLADVLVANCVRHANVVLFSAALPGQQGLHHVNEQLPQYWVEQFAQHNYAVFDFIRPQIWDDPQIPVWYRQNILLFVRQDTAEMAQILAQSSREAFPPPLGIAHPDHLLWLSNQERAAVADLDLMRQRSRQAQADFNLALGDAIKRGEEQARADAETIRAEAVQQQELERLARQAAEAALNEASRQRELEREARAATEARLEDAQQQQELERQARVAAEASLATLTHELQAERQAHLAAGMPAVEPSSEPPAWLALERARDDAVRQLQKAQGARQAAEAALAEVTEQHAFEREIRLAAEATRDQALHERALERQARAAAEAGFADAVHQQEAARHAHAAAVAAHAEAIRHAESIGQAHDEAMRQLATEIAARETAEASVVELNEILRQKDAARVAVEARLENKLRDLDLEIAARRQAEAELAETRRRLAAESATLVAVQAGLAAMRQSEFRAREAQAESEQARLEALRDYEAAAEARALAESELNLAREAQVLAESELNLARQQIEDEVASRGAADASFREARQRLAEETDARRTLQDQHYRQTQELLAVRHHAATLAWERNVITNSALWRLTQPLRALGRRIPFGMRLWMRRYIGAATTPDFATAPVLPHTSGSAMSQPPAPSSAAALEAADSLPQMEIAVHDTAPSRPLCVVFVSGEPNIPGHIYRVQRYMEAAKALGAVSSWLPLSDVVARGEDIARANVLVIWRAPNGPEVSHALWVARSHGVKILFDVDDLMFDPSLASRKIIDGIRTQDLTETEVANYFQRVREVVVQADACTCSTEELARHLRETDRVTFVLPNHFDNDTLTRSRLAVRRRDRQSRDIVRIGYAAGTRTHQRDFRNAAEALARILKERPQCRLVLFRAPETGRPLLDPTEFSTLARFESQIEWRDRVPLVDLPTELARFDINLAPLEVGNPFCEAKSELKYFEAALTEVCTIASPTGPMRRAMRDGVTGRLADTTQEWYRALRDLIDDPASRRRMAHAAYLDTLGRCGPQASIVHLESVLRQVSDIESTASAFHLDLLRRRSVVAPEFDIPPSSVVFSADKFGDAEVTVIVPLYNYAHYVEEALDSVVAQTIPRIDLVVVDDASTDDSLKVATAWARRNADRFNRIVVTRNEKNSGLARSRNVGFDMAETPFVLPLDADNRLLPDCCGGLLDAIRGSRAAFAYSLLQCFGATDHVLGTEPFAPMRFASSNYIDAMALVSKSCWAAVGGYTHIQYGWEDYDFWCKCVEQGLWGEQVRQILAEYRVHENSMLRTSTDRAENKHKVIRQLESRHDWLTIDFRM